MVGQLGPGLFVDVQALCRVEGVLFRYLLGERKCEGCKCFVQILKTDNLPKNAKKSKFKYKDNILTQKKTHKRYQLILN